MGKLWASRSHRQTTISIAVMAAGKIPASCPRFYKSPPPITTTTTTTICLLRCYYSAAYRLGSPFVLSLTARWGSVWGSRGLSFLQLSSHWGKGGQWFGMLHTHSDTLKARVMGTQRRRNVAACTHLWSSSRFHGCKLSGRWRTKW